MEVFPDLFAMGFECGEAPTPLRKESLIEKIWNSPYDPAFDSRLYKLIERARQNNINIISLNRAYFIQ
jgi:hypothetical protein